MIFPSPPPSRISSALHLLSLFAAVQTQLLGQRGHGVVDFNADGGSATAGNGGNVTGNGTASGGNAIGGKGGSIGDIGGTSSTADIGPSASLSIDTGITLTHIAHLLEKFRTNSCRQHRPVILLLTAAPLQAS